MSETDKSPLDMERERLLEDDGFEIQTPEKTREAFVPEINGMTMWHKPLQCDLCQSYLRESVMILKWQAPALTFACLECFQAMARRYQPPDDDWEGRNPFS